MLDKLPSKQYYREPADETKWKDTKWGEKKKLWKIIWKVKKAFNAILNYNLRPVLPIPHTKCNSEAFVMKWRLRDWKPSHSPRWNNGPFDFYSRQRQWMSLRQRKPYSTLAVVEAERWLICMKHHPTSWVCTRNGGQTSLLSEPPRVERWSGDCEPSWEFLPFVPPGRYSLLCHECVSILIGILSWLAL